MPFAGLSRALRWAALSLLLPAAALAPLELAMCVGTVFRMLKDMNVIEGRRFGVSGLGPAGLVALQMAKAEGAAGVYGFDPVADRQRFKVTYSGVVVISKGMKLHAAAYSSG